MGIVGEEERSMVGVGEVALEAPGSSRPAAVDFEWVLGGWLPFIDMPWYINDRRPFQEPSWYESLFLALRTRPESICVPLMGMAETPVAMAPTLLATD